MVRHGVELARRADDASNGEDGEVDPARGFSDAMAKADVQSEEEAWNVDEELKDSYAIAVTKSHCSSSSEVGRRKSYNISRVG